LTVGSDCSTSVIARASPSDRTTALKERCTVRRRCSSSWLYVTTTRMLPTGCPHSTTATIASVTATSITKRFSPSVTMSLMRLLRMSTDSSSR
jgi:hypothetical protein